MVMHTETVLRVPAWLIAVAVVTGVALGLWQVGAFDRSTDGGRGAGAHAVAGPSRNRAGIASADLTAGKLASPINRAAGRQAERPIATPDHLARDLDPEVRDESDALQAALAAEQTSH
jgi:hypothetical protein